MKKKLIILSGFVLGLAPVAALAVGVTGGSGCGANNVGASITTLEGLMCKISQLLGMVVPVLISLGVVYFVWGVITYMVGSDEEAKKKGRDRVIFGIIGLAVIVAMWGLVSILTTTFGVSNNQGNITLPILQ